MLFISFHDVDIPHAFEASKRERAQERDDEVVLPDRKDKGAPDLKCEDVNEDT